MTAAWELICALSGFGSHLHGMAFLLFLLALAGLTAGILVLTLRRNKGVLIFALAAAGATALLCLMAPTTNYFGAVLPLTLFPLAVAATILASISLSRENRSAWQR